MNLTDLHSFDWPAGFEVGAVARVTRRRDTEGRIVGLEEPPTALDEPLVELRQEDGTRVFATMRGCEIRGLDYEIPTEPRARRRAKQGATAI